MAHVYTDRDVCELQKCNYNKTRACKCLHKEFGANRVTLSVQFWSFLPDEEHFKGQAFKLAPAFLKNSEILSQVHRSQTMFVLEVFSYYGMFMFLCTLMEVGIHVTDIICIAQMTFKFVHNTLLVNNGRLQFRTSQVVNVLFASKNWLQIVIDLSPKVTKWSANQVSRFLILEWHRGLRTV